MRDKDRLFSEYQGFDVMLPKHMEYDKAYVILRREGSNQYSVPMDGDKEMGVCQRLDHCLENLSKELERHQNKLRELMVQQSQARRDLSIGNPYDDEVTILAERLKEIDEKLKEGTAA
jgi:Zn-dependent M32 family carboxypeptidase